MRSPERLPWRLALAIVAAESLLAALGVASSALSVAALVLAPGIALLPLLPAAARRDGLIAVAAAPALGLAGSSVLLVTIAAAGVPLTGLSIRLALAALVLAALALWRDAEGPVLPSPGAALALAGAVAAGLLVQGRVVGELPVPGNDWAKYVLYGDEVRRQGSLLIDNPYWMLGVPFREDPGAPALYGSFLELTGHSAATVARGIWIFAAAQVLAVFALAAATAGRGAGIGAALLYGLLPLNLNLLGWHGVANALALAFLPLLLLHGAGLLAGHEFRRRDAAGFALLLVALAAAHRLSLAIGVAVLALALGAGLLGARRGPILRGVLATGAFAAALAPGVVYDLVTRNRTFGGTQGYEAYSETKVDFELLVRDLTVPFAAVAAAALAAAVRGLHRRPETVPLVAAVAVVVALSLTWVVKLPLHYTRMVYYLPLALCPLVAIVAARHLSRRMALAGTVAVAALVTGLAWPSASNIRTFYAFANPASLRGLDAVADAIRPGEIVVTDRCWSFLGTWLVSAPTLAALAPSDIQPRAEVPRAAEARAVLSGSPEGRALAERLRVRFLLVDPLCPDERGRFSRPPPLGQPVFVSERLVVLEVGGAARAESRRANVGYLR